MISKVGIISLSLVVQDLWQASRMHISTEKEDKIKVLKHQTQTGFGAKSVFYMFCIWLQQIISFRYLDF